MGCTIPGCGSSGHNRRTHDKHVPPGEPLDPTRFLVGERGPSFVAPDEEDQPILDEIIGLADRVRKHVDSVHPDAECTAECDLMGIIAQPLSGGGDLIADVIYESEGEPEYTEAFPGQSHGPDAGQSVVQAATSGDQDPITADDIRAIPGADHECEPAPGQVYFCRHCGEDLMIPRDAAPEPITGSGLDEFAPDVLEAVSRIADEMDAPHGPGCTLADPCDECRRHVAAMAVDPERTIREQMGRTEDVFMCHHERCGHIDEEDCEQLCDDMDKDYAERHDDLDDPYPEQCEHTRCDHHEETECDTGCDDITPPWRTVLGPDEPIRISLPGVYVLEAHEYHDPAVTGDWVSNSDLRAMSAPHCPAKWKYNRDHGVRVTSPAFSFGHAWHARVLGKGESIAVRPAQWSDWRKQEARDWRAEQEAAGRSVILPEDWDAVEAMAAAIYDREEATRLLTQPGRPELAMFWVDKATGVKRRALVDFMPDRPNADGVLEIVDIKSTDSASPDDDMERKIYKYGYFRQGVTIMDGAIALGLAEDATVFFIFQEKTAPYLVQEVELDAQAQLAGSIENHRALMVYKECLETGVWPSYSPGAVTLSLPPYILARYEDEIEVSH